MKVITPKIDIICAGIPRSGSTMLYRALAGLEPGTTTPTSLSGPILKTHSFRPHEFKGVRAAIFIFGDPIAAVISTRIRRWDKGHFKNCEAENLDPETANIFEADILNYEKMFDAWMQRQAFDTICVRYERLHENIHFIERFLNFPIKLPDRKPRSNYYSQVRARDLFVAKLTYRNLIKKIACAPDLSLWIGSAKKEWQ